MILFHTGFFTRLDEDTENRSISLCCKQHAVHGMSLPGGMTGSLMVSAGQSPIEQSLIEHSYSCVIPAE